MKRIITYPISQADANMTIASYLKKQAYTSKILASLKKQENPAFLLNSKPEKTNILLKAGDILQVTIEEKESSEHIEPEDIALNILFEDEDILVINKPAGMPIHPSVNHHSGTLANAVAGYYQRQGENYIFRCINRLDRDTSGVTILAKHALSAGILQKAVKEGEIHKEYRAIVTGETKKAGMIELPIGRKEGSIIERKIDLEKGQDALTHYRRISTYQMPESEQVYSYLAILLETGRTHQIRVHMKAIGHPIPGDFLYNPDYRDIKRQALHCYRMSFRHPISAAYMEFTAQVPEDMQKLITPAK